MLQFTVFLFLAENCKQNLTKRCSNVLILNGFNFRTIYNHSSYCMKNRGSMDKPVSKPEVKSPCRLVCRLNESGMCVGCFRMLDEIANWEIMSNEERFDVLRKAHLRMQLRNMKI